MISCCQFRAGTLSIYDSEYFGEVDSLPAGGDSPAGWTSSLLVKKIPEPDAFVW